MTLAGGAFESALAPHLNPHSLYALLAIAGGSFLYLGGHAVHGELRRSGPAAYVLAGTDRSSRLQRPAPVHFLIVRSG